MIEAIVNKEKKIKQTYRKQAIRQTTKLTETKSKKICNTAAHQQIV